MQLSRADIGFGHVVVDRRGVMRHGLFRSRRVAWDDITAYALAIRPTVAPYDPANYPAVFGGLAYARDLVTNQHERAFLCEIELRGGAQPVAFGWRFRDAHLAIQDIVQRVHDPLARRAREQLHWVGMAAFGPLGIAAESIAWGATSLPRGRVEAIEIFDTRPLELRVIARDRARPFARAATRGVPNLLVALAIARDLGYPTRGAGLLREVFARPPRDVLNIRPG